MRHYLILCLSVLTIAISSAEAAFTFRNGKLVNAGVAPTRSIREHYLLGRKAFEECDWKEAANQFRVVTVSDPHSTSGKEAFYYLGVSLYYLDELDLANDSFTAYIKANTNPAYFDNVIEYKFLIAQHFSNGAKRRPFGSKQFPKWLSAHSSAIEIYDEVIAAIPAHEMAAKSLYSKGYLLWKNRDYKESIVAYQTLIKRFPKHELTPNSYLFVTCAYLGQAQKEYQNPDILALADIAYRKFEVEYPRAEQLVFAKENVEKIREGYAGSFVEIGEFYERTNRTSAAIIYYQNALRRYPDTRAGQYSRERLSLICPKALCVSDSSDS